MDAAYERLLVLRALARRDGLVDALLQHCDEA